MNSFSENLDSIMEQIRANLSAKDKAREKLLPLYREVIRYSSTSIRAIHRQEFDKAEGLIKSARNLLEEAGQVLAESEELRHSGYIRDAQKEYAEASITFALVKKNPLPDTAELNIESAAYLNGMGEAVGELRRFLLDSMRHGDMSRGEDLLSAMDEIYSVLVTMDFPDAITGGLRRTTDNVRGILEKTRGDLTVAIQQKELTDKLKDFQK